MRHFPPQFRDIGESARFDQKTDADLLKEFSGSGSHGAFATLVNCHGPMVHAVAVRTLSKSDVPDEVSKDRAFQLASAWTEKDY